MLDQEVTNSALMQEKELLDILMDSDLYLELPLKERHLLFKHIINVYLCSSISNQSGTC